MFQGLRDDVSGLRAELAQTRESIRRYNGLWEKVAALERQAQQAAGRAAVGRGIREWGGWALALLSTTITLIKVFF